jgi:hypothetical protein
MNTKKDLVISTLLHAACVCGVFKSIWNIIFSESTTKLYEKEFEYTQSGGKSY